MTESEELELELVVQSESNAESNTEQMQKLLHKMNIILDKIALRKAKKAKCLEK